MSANALPVITVHGHASNPGTVTEPTVYEQALARLLSPESLPAHIGVLVDGNRRWAAQRGLSTREGHAAGAERIIDFLAWCTELSIPQVSLYMLSTENLKRPEKELTGLVAVIDAFLVRLVESACGPVRAIGNIDLIPRQLHERLDWAIEQTAHLPGVRGEHCGRLRRPPGDCGCGPLGSA